MTFLRVGNHIVNLDKVCNFQVWDSKEPGCTVVQIEYEHSSYEIPCAGCYSKVFNDLRAALSKHHLMPCGLDMYREDVSDND